MLEIDEAMIGLKQVNIGLIPEDWEEKQLSDIGKFSKGQGVRKDESQSGDIPCIRYGEIYTHHNDYIKKFYSFISPEISKQAKKIEKGDLLFAGSGETKAEIGKCVEFIDDFEAYAGGDIIILSPKNVSSKLLGYLLNAPIVQKQKASRGQGDAIVHITANHLKDIYIALPAKKEEQTAIATALSDTDALIENLEKLIEKKRNIKQGVMHKIFHNQKNWVRKEFNKVCWFQEGPGLRNWQFTDKGIKVINVTNLENGYLNLERTDRYISLDEFNKMYTHFEIDENDIVVASSGNSYGKVAVVRKQDLPLLMNTSVIRFKPLKDLDYNFLLVFLKSKEFKNQIDFLITGGAQPNFGPFHLNKIFISLPPNMETQQSVASIIMDVDKEIEELEQKLYKFRMLKQGMMQVLLTGKIRLV